MLKRLRQGLLLLSFVGSPAMVAADCDARDFLTLDLPQGGDPVAVALELAYPGVRVSGDMVSLPSGVVLPLGKDGGRAPKSLLTDATIREQFHYPYPLAFDLEPRKIGWNDPGRVRNDAFFRGLYFADKGVARASLEKVRYSGKSRTSFLMTAKHGVACQLAAAMDQIAAGSEAGHPSLRNVGGSFNWRRIAGTQRLSTHSFGIALDLNTKYGGYWRWGKEPEGQVGPYRNGIPEPVVVALERFGFIWGGKWHHYDGMHFEYRPELILFARLKAAGL